MRADHKIPGVILLYITHYDSLSCHASRFVILKKRLGRYMEKFI